MNIFGVQECVYAPTAPPNDGEDTSESANTRYCDFGERLSVSKRGNYASATNKRLLASVSRLYADYTKKFCAID